MTIESRQTVLEYSEVPATYGIDNDYGIEDLMALKEDVRSLISLVNDSNSTFTPQFGTGSPEGVVTSNFNRTYYDTTLSPVSVTLYVNQNIGVSTGWVIVV